MSGCRTPTIYRSRKSSLIVREMSIGVDVSQFSGFTGWRSDRDVFLLFFCTCWIHDVFVTVIKMDALDGKKKFFFITTQNKHAQTKAAFLQKMLISMELRRIWEPQIWKQRPLYCIKVSFSVQTKHQVQWHAQISREMSWRKEMAWFSWKRSSGSLMAFLSLCVDESISHRFVVLSLRFYPQSI